MESLTSPSWYRVCELRPRIDRQLEFHRHRYRGRAWIVLRNPTTKRVLRVSANAHSLIERMDGTRSVQQIWDEALHRLGDDAPTQDETIALLSQLDSADVLHCDASADTEALFRQLRERIAREQRGARNPIAFRVPLVDPDAWLTRAMPIVQPLFSRAGFFAWLAVLLVAGLTAARNAPELAAASARVLEPTSLAALWFVYPLVKALHELGHAFAVKRWGGEVHDLGVLFLVFLPLPYVDASSASAFPEKHRRVVVSAAGIAVELFLASLGLLVFLAVEPGLVRELAWAVFVVGGVSTALFNGNPLLRYDGYYVLSDAIEIPNLDGRGRQLLGGLVRRRLLGLRQWALPETTEGEAPWLIGYALAAPIYRTAVALGIALFLAQRFFVVGVALAAFTLVNRFALPIAKQLHFLLYDPSVGERRARALSFTLLPLAVLLVLLFVLPVPLRTRVEGVVFLPEHSAVRAGTQGFVSEWLVEPHTQVEVGDALALLRDAEGEVRVRRLEAERSELRMKAHALDQKGERVQADIVREQLERVEDTLARAGERANAATIRSPSAGLFVPTGGATEWIGRHVRQGDLIGHAVDLSAAKVRIVVRQPEASLVRESTRKAWVRTADAPGRVLEARIAREVPSGSNRLPSRALSTEGGGSFVTDPADEEGLRTLETVFQFELALPRGTTLPVAGQRVHARLDHGSEPLAARLERAARRLFLRQLGV